MSIFTCKGMVALEYTGTKGPNWVLREHNTMGWLTAYGSFEECMKDVYGEFITYHRNPTNYELKMGYGAIHYMDFNPIDCVKDDGELKKWFRAEDGLRYYL